ncbi:hypothetical protein F751_6553 [Auxenochlorella protothecoides]|uniref:Uncharacterized protein n=1 Tax=Auxenochlorella protothecoides TaxID=3075 RepID=A0A087STI0_AUXPR|nr:hypothetical protein F751_6553 [Auxenochlorella protothecoides]KFM29034.1 hypothetical protein F751_6553 [Auxenochlorella protothecoides]
MPRPGQVWCHEVVLMATRCFPSCIARYPGSLLRSSSTLPKLPQRIHTCIASLSGLALLVHCRYPETPENQEADSH